MSDPFCQECDGKGYIIEQAYEDELDDENMNVIARTNLAQPVTKRETDKFMFRVKVDF